MKLVSYCFVLFHCVNNYNLFIHSTINGHSHSSQYLAIMNHSAVNILVHGFWEIYVYIYVGDIPRSGISGSLYTRLSLSVRCQTVFWQVIFHASR